MNAILNMTVRDVLRELAAVALTAAVFALPLLVELWRAGQ